MVKFDRLYMTFYWLVIVSIPLSCTIFELIGIVAARWLKSLRICVIILTEHRCVMDRHVMASSALYIASRGKM